MGGITRIIRSLPLVKKVIPKTPVAQTVEKIQDLKAEPQTTTAPTPALDVKKPTFGGGTQGTILTSPRGLEEDANVAKTRLGGAVKKKPTSGSVGY